MTASLARSVTTGVPAKRPWFAWSPGVLAILFAVGAGLFVRHDNVRLVDIALDRTPTTAVTVHPGGRVKVSYAVYAVGSWGVLDFGPLRLAFPDQPVRGRSSGTMMLYVPGERSGRNSGIVGWGARRLQYTYDAGVLTLDCFGTTLIFEKGVLERNGLTLDVKTAGPTRIDFDKNGDIVRVRPL